MGLLGPLLALLDSLVGLVLLPPRVGLPDRRAPRRALVHAVLQDALAEPSRRVGRLLLVFWHISPSSSPRSCAPQLSGATLQGRPSAHSYTDARGR